MSDKFTIEDLFIKIIPGGVIIGVTFFLFGSLIKFELIEGFDFFYTFLFIVFSYLMGEVIQTIAHELEWVINLFFKFYRPSEIFLYKNNPIVNNEVIRMKLLNFLSISPQSQLKYDKEYKELPLFRGREKQNEAQSYFWHLYTKVEDNPNIKTFNRNYLLVRAITICSIFLTLLLFIEGEEAMMIGAIIIFFLFLWRARGMAKTLVFKTVLISLREKNYENNNL